MNALSARSALVLVSLAAACSEADNKLAPDAGSSCDPATVLPQTFRPIAMVSTGAVEVTTAAGVTTGTIDARAGGFTAAADNPYVYVDLLAGTKVAINDIEARTSSAWDIALKRASVRANGGDSGTGGRQIAIVQAGTLAEVTAGPSTGYATDDFTTDDCMLDALESGEPRSTFGEWYGYTVDTHKLQPKPEVYVIERGNGTRTAFRIVNYYGDEAMTIGALYQVEWKQLPGK